MDINVITKEEFNQLINKMDSLERKIEAISGVNTKALFTVDEVCRLLNVSKRTLQRYRDQQLLSFTQVGAKILFQASDIQLFLEKNKVKIYRN